MGISISPVTATSSSNYSISSLLSPQDSAKMETDAALVQTLTQASSGLSSLPQADLITNIEHIKRQGAEDKRLDQLQMF